MTSIDRFIEAVQKHQFKEAHELLEDDWKAYKKIGLKDHARILKGLINGTTSIALFVKGRPPQCLKIWAVFNKYMPLLDTTDLENKERFIYAKELLEKKFAEVVKI